MYPILIRQLTVDEAKIIILIRAPVSPNQHILGVESVKEQKPAKHLDLHGAFTLPKPFTGLYCRQVGVQDPVKTFCSIPS